MSEIKSCETCGDESCWGFGSKSSPRTNKCWIPTKPVKCHTCQLYSTGSHFCPITDCEEYQSKPKPLGSAQGKPVKADTSTPLSINLAERIKELQQLFTEVYLCEHSFTHEDGSLEHYTEYKAGQAAALFNGMVEVAENQTPPEIVILPHSRGIGCPHCGEEFGVEGFAEAEQHEAQDNMLTLHDNGDGTVSTWRRVIIPKEE